MLEAFGGVMLALLMLIPGVNIIAGIVGGFIIWGVPGALLGLLLALAICGFAADRWTY